MSWEISGNSSVVEAPLILAEVNCDGESIASKLQSLALKASPQVQKEIEDVLSSLSDVISTTLCTTIIQDGIDSEEEAKMWTCFAQVYKQEIEAYKTRKGRPASINRKRQIFADILMWAEMLMPGYDQATAAFMTGQHVEDESFVRVGKSLREAKQIKGILRL